MTRTICTFLLLLGLSASGGVKEEAKQLLEKAGLTGGVVVHAGCGAGDMTRALFANDRYVVHGLDEDAAEVAKAQHYLREWLKSRGWI